MASKACTYLSHVELHRMVFSQGMYKSTPVPFDHFALDIKTILIGLDVTYQPHTFNSIDSQP